MANSSHIQSAASKSIRPFRSSEEYLEAMKEDLAEWFNTLYDLDIQVDTFLESLETGCHLCRHANNVNRTALDFQERHPEAAARMRVPQNEVVFQAKNVVPGSFIARDNVSNFIQWCRQDLGIQDVLMFETNDLVLKKNEKNFVLCLLEVARRGSKFGMLAPMLIQMEEEIEEEMRDQMGDGALGTRRESRDLQAGAFPGRARPITLCDLKNLDELVRHALPWEPCAWVRASPATQLRAPPGPLCPPNGRSVLRGSSRLSLWSVGGPVCPPSGCSVVRGRSHQSLWSSVSVVRGRSCLPTQRGALWSTLLCGPQEVLSVVHGMSHPSLWSMRGPTCLRGPQEFLSCLCVPWEVLSAHPVGALWSLGGLLCPPSGVLCGQWEVPPISMAPRRSSVCLCASLNVFAKHGLPAEDGRRSGNSDGNNNNGNNGNNDGLCPPTLPSNPSVGDVRRRSTLSSSSDESCCFPASWDNRETPGNPGSDTDWAPGEDELLEMEETPLAPGVSTPPRRPWAKPRLDTQPHKAPSRIPTPRGYGVGTPRPHNGSPKAWGALQSVFSSLLEPPWAPREREGLEEDTWP
ncbi:GAS2-like protein 1 [Manacus vitellinus]|uniref:GAS2-like protein 1 n=1 Tax=Manacus vitellinus TaxID=328815 RepID=UPI00115E4DFC|nr:GAS2-like protein 1 [Manacus vitellinus]